MVRSAYGVALLLVAVGAAYAFGVISGGAAGHFAGFRSEVPAASELMVSSLRPPPGLSLVLLPILLAAAVGGALLFRADGQRAILELVGSSRAAVIDALVTEEAAISPLEVVLGTVAAGAGGCCGLVIWGLVEAWTAETVAVVSCLAGIETFFGLILVVMVIIQRPRSVAMFAAATVAVCLEVALIVSVIFASTA